MQIREIKDKTQWENFLRDCKEKTFLQSFDWGEFQKAIGKKVWRQGLFENENLVAIAQVIKISAKRGTFLFVPHGPVLRSSTGNPKSQISNPKQIQNTKSQILSFLLEELKRIAKKEKASFVRIAPIWERNEENIKIFRDLGFRPAPLHIHPEVTWQLDITQVEDELLQAMRKTTRYLIRQGLKDENLKILKSENIKDLEIFNEIYQKTAERHEFAPFSFDYLKNEFLAFLQDNQIALFLAKYQEEFIAGAVIVFWQDIGFYHHGASLKSYPKIPASYLIQWEAIKEAKRRGCKIYNFWGIAPLFGTKSGNPKSKILNPKQIQNSKFQILNRKHPWAGLTLFKTGFGGYKKEYVKTQDFIISQKYWLNFIVEKLRKIKRGY